jgi:two-component system OmpR family sensor kinase
MAPVGVGNWRVVIQRSEQDVLGSARNEFIAVVAGVALVALAVVLLAWFVGGRRERSAREARETRARIEALNLQLEHRLGDVERALGVKDDFLGSVSHELRTPLTSLVGLAHMLQGRAAQLDEETRDEALGQVVADADRLQRIIENMLVLARLDRSAATDLEPLLIQRVMAPIIEAHRHLHPGRQLDVTVEDHLPTVLAKTMWIDQVVSNLLTNAEKYTPADMPITVAARAVGEVVIVTVEDRGPGLSAEEAAQVFEPFERLERDRYRASGSGLGLAVSRRLVELMNGAIWAAPREGGGSTFAFTLLAIEQPFVGDDAPAALAVAI